MPGESVADLGTSVPVDVFSAEEALALLDGRTGLADEAGAAAVAAELGYLPLALDQAAAVIAGQRLGYGTYLERLRAVPVEEQLARAEGAVPRRCRGGGAAVPGCGPGGWTGGRGRWDGDHGRTVGGRGPPHVLGCLREASALAAEGHRVSVAMVDHALAQLTDQAMLTLTIDGQTVIMHRLIAGVVRDNWPGGSG